MPINKKWKHWIEQIKWKIEDESTDQTKKELKEIMQIWKSSEKTQKELDYIIANKTFDDIKECLKYWRGISWKDKLKELIEFIRKYWETFIPGATYKTIAEMDKKCDEILLKDQYWEVDKIMRSDENSTGWVKGKYVDFGFIHTGLSKVYVENPPIEIKKWDMVKFRVRRDLPNHKNRYTIVDVEQIK